MLGSSPVAVSSPLGQIRQVDAGVLNIGYVDAGPADGPAGPYAHRVLARIGHNMPQEAPDAFVDAIRHVGDAR
jgi:hypothetical protein